MGDTNTHLFNSKNISNIFIKLENEASLVINKRWDRYR